MTRILVVDDHTENRYFLRALLEANGFEVVEAAHGGEAMAEARRQPPDLVVADLLMPVVDGYTLLRQWRAHHVFRTIPLIVYTATYTEPRDERLAMALGADAFIVKPAEPEELLSRVKAVLEMRDGGTLPSSTVRPLEEQVLLQEHNEVLVRKLEQKAIEAERRNLDLREEVAERRRAEERLRESEEVFRTTFEQAAVGIAHVALDGRFVWVNKSLCEMTGYTVRELSELTLQAITAPRFLMPGDIARGSLTEGERDACTGDVSFTRRDGTVFWVNVVATLKRDRGGVPQYYILVAIDVTQRRQAEGDLLLRDRAIQVLPQGILITDPLQPDNPIIYASEGVLRMTGYAPPEVLGRNCRILQGPDTDRDTVSAIRRAIVKGESCTVEVLNYRKDGQSFWNGLSISPVRDDAHRVVNFVGVLSDVTERRRLEDELRQAQKMEAVGRLAGGVAHDFNNLLTIICGYSELLLSVANLEPQDREVVDAIREAGERASALTRQLLGFSRRTILQPQVVSLNGVVTDTAKMLGRLLGEDIELSTNLAPRLRPVRVDPGQMDQLLMNLVVNARDAMPRGGRLTIETADVHLDAEDATSPLPCHAGDHVMLTVTDTGIGMPPEVVARIFEPFFTTKPGDQGTGLGLSTVFSVVQQSGGCIRVQSQPGSGTSFRIYLPAVPDSVAQATTTESAAAPRGVETVFIVEDDAGVRAMAARGLRMQGYAVFTAPDGATALKLIDDQAPAIDLLLTDVVMPGLSGPDLAAQLTGRFPRLLVLFMSGYTDGAVVRHGLVGARASFIQKPFTPQTLASKVRRVLDQGESPT